MSNGTKVKKRDGRSESLNLEKMHKMVEEACKGLAGVSASQVEIQSGFSFMTVSQLVKFKRSSFVVLVILLIWIILTTSSLLLDSYSFL